MARKEVLALYTDIAIAFLRKKLRDVGRGWSRNILIVRAAYDMLRDILHWVWDMLRDMLQGVFSDTSIEDNVLGYASMICDKGAGICYNGDGICYNGAGI